jgi:hypothetical protein
MPDLAKLLRDKPKLKAKILAMPKSEAKKYLKLIKILALTDRQAIDALAATYFHHHTGVNPLPSEHQLPAEFVTRFNDDKEFFIYLSDLLKERIR